MTLSTPIQSSTVRRRCAVGVGKDSAVLTGKGLCARLKNRLYRYDIRGQRLNSVGRKVPRHGAKLGRLLGLLAPARGCDGNLGQVAFKRRWEKGSRRTEAQGRRPESETLCD